MAQARITIKQADEACSLVEKYGSITEAARRGKISRGTLNSRLDAAIVHYGFEPGKSRVLPDGEESAPMPADDPSDVISPTPTSRLGGSAADRKIIALNDEVRRLTSALREAHREQINDDGVRGILGTLAAEEASPPPWILDIPTKIKDHLTPEVPVAIFGDLHIGEVVEKT